MAAKRGNLTPEARFDGICRLFLPPLDIAIDHALKCGHILHYESARIYGGVKRRERP
jgi:hypothetical protein